MGSSIAGELREVAAAHDGVLRAADVVAFARGPKRRLHACFEWEDGEAAHQYRLWQARQLIRVRVIRLEDDHHLRRAYVSLKPDRQEAGGGYRSIVAVLRSRKGTDQMLDDALTELRAVREKYKHLQELVEVWSAMDRVGRRRFAMMA